MDADPKDDKGHALLPGGNPGQGTHLWVVVADHTVVIILIEILQYRVPIILFLLKTSFNIYLI